MTDQHGHTADHDRFLLAALAAHIRRNTADNSLSLSDDDVRAAYGSDLQFQVRRDPQMRTVRIVLVE